MVLMPAAGGTDAHESAFPLEFSTNLRESGWRTHTPSGQTPAEFDVSMDGALTVVAADAVSFIYQELPKTSDAYSTLSWQWRVDRDFPPTDLSQPGADDRPLAVHVYFEDARAGLMSRMAGLVGMPASGHAITYVWGGVGPAGQVIANPFMKEGKGALIVLQPSDPDAGLDWVDVDVDLASDYRRVFNDTPPRLRGIAISSDTDDTGATASASIRRLSLSHRVPP